MRSTALFSLFNGADWMVILTKSSRASTWLGDVTATNLNSTNFTKSPKCRWPTWNLMFGPVTSTRENRCMFLKPLELSWMRKIYLLPLISLQGQGWRLWYSGSWWHLDQRHYRRLLQRDGITATQPHVPLVPTGEGRTTCPGRRRQCVWLPSSQRIKMAFWFISTLCGNHDRFL